MWGCDKCKKKFHVRTEFLLHKSICQTRASLDQLLISNEELDDSDLDATYHPSEDESDSSDRESMNEDTPSKSTDTVGEYEDLFKPTKTIKFIETLPKPHSLASLLLSPGNDHQIDSGVKEWYRQFDSKIEKTTDNEENNNSKRTSKKNNEENNNSKRTSKKNYCKFCGSFQSKITRHFVNKHKDIPEIKAYINLYNDNKKTLILMKREASKLLIANSNKAYNDKVKSNSTLGAVIPLKNTHTTITKLSHVVCSGCGGLLRRTTFYKHRKSCTERKLLLSKQPQMNKKLTSSLLFSEIDEKYELLQKKVIQFMKKDKITLFAQSDPLILEFGRRFLKGHMRPTQRNYVSCKMRSMADLALRAMAQNSSITNMADCCNPENFDTLIKVVREWSKFRDEEGDCEVGSVARRLCKSLKVCSDTLWSQAIRDKTMTIPEQVVIRDRHEKFTQLMNTDWALELNSVGDKTIEQNKTLKEDKLPSEEDILTFSLDMKTRIEKFTTELEETQSELTYKELTKCLLAFLTTFNGRRPSEVQNATITNYKSLQVDDNNLAVFKVSATKNGVKVPIVVPDFSRLALSSLLKVRNVFGIKGDILLSKLDGTPYNTSHLITKFKETMGLKNPQQFSANGMRHYWATISQKHQDIKKHMPKFLGHTISVHEKYYEMPLSDIHLNVIGPLLMDTCLPGNNNTPTKQQKQTESLNEPQTFTFNREDSLTPNESPSPTQSQNLTPRLSKEIKRKSTQIITSDSDSESFDLTPKMKNKKKRIKRHSLIEEVSSDTESDYTSPLKIRKKNAWTTPERKEIFKNLPKTILGVEQPGRGKVRDLWESSKHIRKRHSLQTLRIEVSKYFSKKKHISTPEKIEIENIIELREKEKEKIK